MKERMQGILIGMLIGGAVVGGTSFASSGTNMIEALYSDIKIYIDGTKLNPKDALGNDVEPFIYNGTTYLPVRAVSNAFGKDVSWDENTSSIYITSKKEPDNIGSIDVPGIEKSDTDFEAKFEKGADIIDNQYGLGMEESSSTAAMINTAYKIADIWHWQCLYSQQDLAKYEADAININLDNEIDAIYQSRLSTADAEDIDEDTTLGRLNRSIYYYQSVREYAKSLLYRVYQYTGTVSIDGSVG